MLWYSERRAGELLGLKRGLRVAPRSDSLRAVSKDAHGVVKRCERNLLGYLHVNSTDPA